MARTPNYDRDAALDAAMTVFWRKGYHATSLKDLETELGMKPGSIYAAFESKENLFLLAIQRYFNASRLQFRTQMALATSPLAGLAGHFNTYVGLSEADPSRQVCMLMKTLVDTNATDPNIANVSLKYLDEMRAEFARLFEAARDAGEIASDADTNRLARRYQANITALRIEMQRGGSKADTDNLAADMAQEVLQLSAAQ
jgi:AcrR family transcriptional regulator